MNFDFNTVEKQENKVFETKYFEVGNHMVRGASVEAGLNSSKQTPYIQITVTDKETGTKECNNRYQLAGGAKEISMHSFIKLVAAANGLDDSDKDQHTKAKAMIGIVNTPEELATKLASLIVGKEFGMHFDGKWYNPTDTTKKSFVTAVFGNYNFAVPTDKFSTLNPKVKTEGTDASTAVATPGVTKKVW